MMADETQNKGKPCNIRFTAKVGETQKKYKPRNILQFFSCEKKMILTKFTLMLTDVAMGSTLPFINLLIVSLGLTASKAGLISGISNIFSIITGPLFGSVADITGQRKLIFLLLCIGTGIPMFSIPWVAELVTKTDDNITCSANNVTNNASLQANGINCSSVTLLNPQDLFYALLGVIILGRGMFCGLICYVEGLVINVVNTATVKTTYGEQKPFGPIGSAIGSVLAGVAVDHYKPKHLSHFTAAFYVFLPSIVLLMPVGYKLIGMVNWERKQDKIQNKTKILKHLTQILKNLDNIVILISVIISGVSYHIYTGFAFLFMHDEMNALKTVMSLTTVSAMASEVIIYPFTSKLIKYLGGAVPTIIVGIFAYFPRFILISYATNAWVMIPIQLIHGISLSLSWTAMLQYTDKIFPKKYTMTAVGIMSTLHFIGTAAFSNMVGGILYHKYGGRQLFRWCAVMAGSWSLFMVLYFGIKGRTIRSSNKVHPQPPNVNSKDLEFQEIP